MSVLLEQYNMFLDTERCLSADSKGDSVQLPLGQVPIIATGSGQSIRLTLNEFSMPRSWYNVNANNNSFTLREAVSVVPPFATNAVIPGNYETVYDMLTEGWLGNATGLIAGVPSPFVTALLTLGSLSGNTVTAVTLINPTTTNQILSNNSLIIDFTVTLGTPVANLALVNPIIQLYVADGDSFLLLGGQRITSPGNPAPASFTTTVVSTTQLRFTGFYNATTTTENHLYLRINEQSSNICNSALDSINVDSQKTEMSSTRILAVIPNQQDIINYTAPAPDIFFTNILAKQVSQLSIQVTDSVGRTFPLMNPLQSTLGNRYFTAVIQVGIYQSAPSPYALAYTPIVETTPAKRSTQPNTALRYGVAAFGLNSPGQVNGDGFFGIDGQLRPAYATPPKQ